MPYNTEDDNLPQATIVPKKRGRISIIWIIPLVTAVQLASDYSRVEVTAKIAKRAEGLIVEDAKFWVVEPRVTLSGISGLGTLLAGNYIGFEVGKSTKSQRKFVGLDIPPAITSDQAGRQFALKAESLGSVGIGSPLY